MSKTVYDMANLEKLDGLDVETAMKQFPSPQAYFYELDRFVEESKSYFSKYSSAGAVLNKEFRDGLRFEAKRIKFELITLGMTQLVSELSDLEIIIDDIRATDLVSQVSAFCTNALIMAKVLVSLKTVLTEDVSQNIVKPEILAVDDKPELLTAIVNMLRDSFTVMGATSGNAALKIMETRTPSLILLDIDMPRMDGYELSKIIRKMDRFANVPIIFLTGKGTRSAVITAIKTGGNDYIVKPAERDILIEKINRLLI